MYNVIIYLIQFGVAVASLFSEKVRKMWKGECASFGVLRDKLEPDANTSGSMQRRSASLSRAGR